MMLGDNVIDECYHGVEAEQHKQSLANEKTPARDKVSHNKTVYTLEAGS